MTHVARQLPSTFITSEKGRMNQMSTTKPSVQAARCSISSTIFDRESQDNGPHRLSNLLRRRFCDSNPKESTQQLDERRWRDQDDRYWKTLSRRQREEMERQSLWAKFVVVAFLAISAFASVIIVTRSQDRPSQPAGTDTKRTEPSSLASQLEQRTFDFDDPSPITERTALLHLIRYGGYATILKTDARELRNRFTEEKVLTVGQLRRYQVMLDLHDQRIDDSVPSKIPRDVVEAVMSDLRK